MWDGLKINYGAHVHRQKETCQPVNQCVSLMCFFNSISTTLEVWWCKGNELYPGFAYTVNGCRWDHFLVVVCGHKYII